MNERGQQKGGDGERKEVKLENESGNLGGKGMYYHSRHLGEDRRTVEKMMGGGEQVGMINGRQVPNEANGTS
jgi:hypothetical protein